MIPPRAAIVGGGIVGAACAADLSAAGWAVTVVEPGVIGGGATAEGMGHIVVMDDSEAQFALTKLSVDLWHELAPRLPASCEYRSTGTMWVAADDFEMAAVREKLEFYRSRGVRAEQLDSRDLASAEPLLRPGLAGALVVPDDGVVYPPPVAAWLLQGSTAVRDRAVSIGSGRVQLQSGGTLEADIVINAAGVAAPSLTPGLAIEPRKGHLLITDRHPGRVHRQIIELGYLHNAHGTRDDSVAFNCQPRATGQLLIGSSRQFGVDTRDVEPAMLAQMLRRAVSYMPGLRDLHGVRAWTGFRPSTPDNLPYVGPVPGDGTAFVAAGHEGLGITTALGSARLLADLVLNRPPSIDPHPYRVDRP